MKKKLKTYLEKMRTPPQKNKEYKMNKKKMIRTIMKL